MGSRLHSIFHMECGPDPYPTHFHSWFTPTSGSAGTTASFSISRSRSASVGEREKSRRGGTTTSSAGRRASVTRLPMEAQERQMGPTEVPSREATARAVRAAARLPVQSRTRPRRPSPWGQQCSAATWHVPRGTAARAGNAIHTLADRRWLLRQQKQPRPVQEKRDMPRRDGVPHPSSLLQQPLPLWAA